VETDKGEAKKSDLFIVYAKTDSRRAKLIAFTDLFRGSWKSPIDEQLLVKLRYRFGS